MSKKIILQKYFPRNVFQPQKNLHLPVDQLKKFLVAQKQHLQMNIP